MPAIVPGSATEPLSNRYRSANGGIRRLRQGQAADLALFLQSTTSALTISGSATIGPAMRRRAIASRQKEHRRCQAKRAARRPMRLPMSEHRVALTEVIG